jgi:hypothetical protein
MSEWGPGLCSIAGDPPFNKIFKEAACFLHRVKGGKICAKTTSDIGMSILLSSGIQRTKIKNWAF